MGKNTQHEGGTRHRKNQEGDEKDLAFIDIPELNQFTSRKEWEEACWKKLLDSKEALDRIVTPSERHNIVLRAAAVHRIRRGASYNKIARELWLSPQTISAIKKGLREKRYRSYVVRGERKKKVWTVIRHPQHSPKMGNPRKTKYGRVYL